MTRFEKIKTWTSEDISDFIVSLIKNTLYDLKDKIIDLDTIRWDLVAYYYNDFLNEEDIEDNKND